MSNKKEWIKSGRDYVREMVRKRDKYRCRDCKRRWKEGDRRFDTHHLHGLCGKKSRGYDSINEMDVLITLCHKCHYNRPEHTTKFSRPRCKEPAKRNNEIRGKYADGVPRKVLAVDYNLSWVRIYQLTRKQNGMV